MFNNVHRIGITVSPSGGVDPIHVLYGYPPLHHSIIACGRTEVVHQALMAMDGSLSLLLLCVLSIFFGITWVQLTATTGY